MSFLQAFGHRETSADRRTGGLAITERSTSGLGWGAGAECDAALFDARSVGREVRRRRHDDRRWRYDGRRGDLRRADQTGDLADGAEVVGRMVRAAVRRA